MISLLLLKGRRVKGRGWRGAACLMLIMSPLSSVMVSLVLCGRLALPWRAAVLLPMALTLRS